MELFFLVLLVVILAAALGSGYPVAFAIAGSAIVTIALAALSGYLFTGDVDAFFTPGGGPKVWLSAGVMNFRGVYRDLDGDILIAIPLFVFMGLMLQASRVAEDLLVAMAQLFGPVRGGLGVSVIFVGALLAATSGIVGATVVALGMISLPTMLRNNYSKPLATGLITATGTLGQIIPPSIVLIILVQQLTSAVSQAGAERRALYKAATGEFAMPSELSVASVSAGDMFIGAIIPGLMLVGLYMAYVVVNAFLRPHVAPAMPRDESRDLQLAIRALRALIPPLALIFIVLGSIIAGVATVNQAGAIGAAGATVMAGYRLYEGRRGAYTPAIIVLLALMAIALILNFFNVNLRKIETSDDVLGIILAAFASALLVIALCWSGWRTLKVRQTLKTVVEETTKTTSLIFVILLAAVMLTAAFRAFGGQQLVRDFLQTLPGGFWSQFTVVMLIIFILGFVLDFIEITLIVVPIVAPILLADPDANITAVWLGVMIALNIQTSFLTPPFGFALFYLRGVAPPTVRTVDIYKGVVPFVVILLLALGIVGAFPSLVNYLPTRMSLLSINAPPPTNPRLQNCLEAYVSNRFEHEGNNIGSAIARARSLNLRIVPINLREELTQSFEKADSAFSLMNRVEEAERDTVEAAVTYRPLLVKVRQLERDTSRIEQEIDDLENAIRRAQSTMRKAIIVEENPGVVSRAQDIIAEDELNEMQDRLSELIVQRNALIAQVPAGWDAASKAFSVIQKAENDARHAYRRNADDAYQALSSVLSMINDVEKLIPLQHKLLALVQLVDAGPVPVVLEQIGSVRSALDGTAGITEIRTTISKARRALSITSPDRTAARELLNSAVRKVATEVVWREQAARDVLPELTAYEAAIADTIGLRGQPRLPDNVAVDVASCVAAPRDIYLNF